MKQQRTFRFVDSKRVLVNLRIHMTIGHENIRPAVVVEIQKLHAKTKEGNTYRSKSRRSTQVSKCATTVIKVVAVIGTSRFHNVRPAIVVIIRCVDSHASLLAPVRAVGDTSLRAHLIKSAMTIVVIQHAWDESSAPYKSRQPSMS